MRAKRKELKSATAQKFYDNIISHHNREVQRVSSAKNADIRIRKTKSKMNLKEKVFNYENYIGGVDMPGEIGEGKHSILSQKSEPQMRPFSA